MANALVSALALAALPSALAFRNTSPFFLFSTADLSIHGHDADVALSTDLSLSIQDSLKGCPTRTTFLVRQEGVSSTDYHDRTTSRLGRYLSGGHKDVKSTMAVAEVVKDIDTGSIASFLQTECGAELLHIDSDTVPARPREGQAVVIDIAMPAPSSDRATALAQYDSLLESLITDFADSQDYTVVYTTTPRAEEQADATLQNQHSYEMEDPFGEAVQMELKRDTTSHRQQARARAREGGLFEKYQYFTPGLFMGFIAITPIFWILVVGVRAIAGLEVSYFAFSKEMGPSGQKKQ